MLVSVNTIDVSQSTMVPVPEICWQNGGRVINVDEEREEDELDDQEKIENTFDIIGSISLPLLELRGNK